jgi:hypothetical protein
MTSFGDCVMSNQSKLSRAANYKAWKFKMKNILMQKMFWHLVSPDLSQPHFEASVRMRLALLKVGTWTPEPSEFNCRVQNTSP